MLFFSLPKSSIIQRHFSAILAKKPTAKMNSIPFTRNDKVLQLQLQSKPWKLLHITSLRADEMKLWLTLVLIRV